jgi:hypothetical protein
MHNQKKARFTSADNYTWSRIQTQILPTEARTFEALAEHFAALAEGERDHPAGQW